MPEQGEQRPSEEIGEQGAKYKALGQEAAEREKTPEQYGEEFAKIADELIDRAKTLPEDLISNDRVVHIGRETFNRHTAQEEDGRGNKWTVDVVRLIEIKQIDEKTQAGLPTVIERWRLDEKSTTWVFGEQPDLHTLEYKISGVDRQGVGTANYIRSEGGKKILQEGTERNYSSWGDMQTAVRDTTSKLDTLRKRIEAAEAKAS